MRPKRASLLLFAGLSLVAAGSASPADPLPASNPEAGLEAALRRVAPTLRREALHAGLEAWGELFARGEVTRPLLTVIDYGLPSTARRLWVFDLSSRRVLFHTLVAHGRNSGENLATAFSNEEGSLMTSLGAYVTGETYLGRNGYSLRLEGKETGRNDHALSRTLVVHGAPYVSETFARRFGRLGRSLGCPAVNPRIARPLIDRVKDGTVLYAWHPSLENLPFHMAQSRD
ncbi:MAG TPA: murein L,D-transpeptidase catalytic domain family protein [Candidatus Polarisedimenticolia bacterium]|nr:murein L,D-transpeptidase catalytic domain family protein [Candidatus Polarisedimenticolia bacterium]